MNLSRKERPLIILYMHMSFIIPIYIYVYIFIHSYISYIYKAWRSPAENTQSCSNCEVPRKTAAIFTLYETCRHFRYISYIYSVTITT